MSKKRAGNKIRQKTDMMPGVNITSRKASVASFNGAGGLGGTLSPSAGILEGEAP